MGTTGTAGADWRNVVAPYLSSNGWRASFQLLTTLGPLALGMWADRKSVV